MPDLTPVGRWLLIGLAALLVLGLAAALAGQWETILLWHAPDHVRDGPGEAGHGPGLRARHRLLPVRAAVPAPRPAVAQRRPPGGAVPDGRRATSWAPCAGRSSSARRSGSTSRSSAGSTCSPSRPATSSTSTSSCTAPRASRPASSYTDANARFFAFDALTVIAALAGGAPRRRRVHAAASGRSGLADRGLAPGDRAPRPVSTRSSSSASPSSRTSSPRSSRTSRNNIPMTRLAYGLDDWETTRLQRRRAADGGGRPDGSGDVPERPPVGLPAARRHARPDPDGPPVLRLHRRRHRPLHHRRRARQVMLSARELDQDERPTVVAGSTSGSRTPTASAWRWCRSTR